MMMVMLLSLPMTAIGYCVWIAHCVFDFLPIAFDSHVSRSSIKFNKEECVDGCGIPFGLLNKFNNEEEGDGDTDEEGFTLSFTDEVGKFSSSRLMNDVDVDSDVVGDERFD